MHNLMALSTTTATTATTASATASNLADVITADMLNGVLDQIIGLLPVVLPVMIGFIALRKGIGFVQSILHSA